MASRTTAEMGVVGASFRRQEVYNADLWMLGIDDRKCITGLGRDYPHPRLAHIYKGTFDKPGDPLCRYGWNREDGKAYSIWRNNVGRDGICKICAKKAKTLFPASRKPPQEKRR